MASHSNLLKLPRQVRAQLWQNLLCPPGGIALHVNQDIAIDDDCLPDEDEDEAANAAYARSLSAASPLPIAILYTNRQIYTECTKILYGDNKFRFECDPVTVRTFLEFFPSTHRHSFKHLAFGRSATTADDGDVRSGWRAMHSFMRRCMKVDVVTIWVPRDGCEEGEWYFWPAAEGLVELLVEGKFGSLRLYFAEAYTDIETWLPVSKPVCLKADVKLEDIGAVEKLTRSRRGIALRREHRCAVDEGTVVVLTTSPR
ncbi:MAG: hypothetical protein L6R39_004663 [Caloplaca ligustica]|nr:MAG: hypothetical protein L6R39_004663 [Caloplaca ligustica]